MEKKKLIIDRDKEHLINFMSFPYFKWTTKSIIGKIVIRKNKLYKITCSFDTLRSCRALLMHC